MEAQSGAQPTTLFSLSTDGEKLTPWKSVCVFLAERTCACCGKVFHPWIKTNADGTVQSYMKEKLWKKQRYCSISCAKRVENGMFDPAVRKKVSKALKTMGHKPSCRGGNGQLTLPQQTLVAILGEGWKPEYVVVTPRPRPKGMPRNYKIDVARPALKIAIEIDGRSHVHFRNRAADKMQTSFLLSRGWSVLHMSNAKTLHLCSTCKSRDILLITLMEYLHTTAT